MRKFSFASWALSAALFLWVSQESYGKTFPPTQFFWGVANASFQVEGQPAPSDWLQWSKTSGKILDGSNADQATNFWDLYEEDFKLAQSLGANAFRMSIAWERIQPSPGKWDEAALSKYQKIIVTMRARGLEPIITLHHFVLPLWLAQKGGILCPDFPSYFAAYAKKVILRLAPPPSKVVYWITFNEPSVLASQGYLSGQWPPGIKANLTLTLRALSKLAQAHLKLSREILRLSLRSHIQLGIAHHWRVFQPASNTKVDLAAAKLLDYINNRYFVDTLTREKGHLDFLGINYYGRSLVAQINKPPFFKLDQGPGPKTDLDWEIYPEGLSEVLKAAASYRLPILITENGIADHRDTLRPQFIKDHLAELFNTVTKDKISVFGYLHWSLTDNFEWAQGLTPRFGLVEIDYKTLARIPRPSFYVYKDIIKNYGNLLSASQARNILTGN